MSFRANLQYLRAQRNLTQERLAMLLGVSRQAISKWESEKAYPEMDKLLMICDLFGCTLDDLVLGDVSRPTASASGVGSSDADASAETTSSEMAGIITSNAELAQDMTGYDEHRRRFALLIAGGVAAIIAGVGIGNLFDSSNSILAATPLNDFLTFLCICVGVIAGLAMLIPGGLSRTDFKRRHPYVEDFYTGEDRSRELRLLVIGIVGGISAILIGIAVTVYADDMLGVSDGWPNAIFLLLCASGVFGFVYCGMRYSLLNINAYNRVAEDDRKERAGEQDFYDKLTGAVCGIITMIATLIGLCLLFLSPAALRGDWSTAVTSMFWVAWPIGGLLCGIAATAIQLFKNYRER